MGIPAATAFCTISKPLLLFAPAHLSRNALSGFSPGSPCSWYRGFVLDNGMNHAYAANVENELARFSPL
jgi:hypothetical protein